MVGIVFSTRLGPYVTSEEMDSSLFEKQDSVAENAGKS